MQVAEVNFNGVISPAGTQFVIPNWQRLYSWEEKEWNDLWEDLVNLYEKVSQGQQVEHFLGPIVVKTLEEKVGEITRRMVIDGQQRLTTLLVICAILRNMALAAKNEKLAKEIEGTILFNEYAKKPEDKPKLRATEADRKALSSIVDGEPESSFDGGSQLSRAYWFFKYRLHANQEKYNIEGLLDLIRKLKIVTINLGEQDNPNRIFETLNFRGKELGQVDLIRNYFMMGLGGGSLADKTYQSLWYPMQEGLGSNTVERIENLEDFLRHYAVMNKQAFVRADRVYGEIRERLRYANEQEMLSELKTITDHAGYYGRLLFPKSRETSPRIRRGIERLNRLDVGVTYPFLLKVYRSYESHLLAEQDVCGILTTIESYFIRRSVRGMPTHSLNRFFASLCSLPDSSLLNTLQTVLVTNMPWQAQYWPSDDEFREAIVNTPIYWNTDRCRLILETLEQSFGHPEHLNFETLTIEHIMPETLSEEWKEHLGSSWEQVFNKYVHNLGNLTLIAGEKNSALSNELLSTKREKWYKLSNVELTKEIVKRWDSWAETEILERSHLLADRAVKIWPRLEPSSGS